MPIKCCSNVLISNALHPTYRMNTTRTVSLPQKKLSKDDINALPLYYYTGKITLVRTSHDVQAALDCLQKEAVLGFDTETRPSFCKGKSYNPTLIQIATAHEVFLFHLKWMPLSAGLLSLFENPRIIKCGVAVHDDMRSLTKISPFAPQTVLDLSAVAKKNGIENQGLRGLVAYFLGLRISKSEQCSNWSNKELTPRQIRYAATDAWTSRAIYLRMQEAGLRV